MSSPGPQPATARITGVVLTCDGQRLLDKCLASLAFCDAILVVDSGSTDQTLAIARHHGARLLARAWDGFDTQFSFAQTQVETDWFFILDQDEICPAELGRLIREAVNDATAAATEGQETPVAFSVGRKSWYFDRFLKHSGFYPDHILRVFRTGCVEFHQDAHIHYRPLGPSSHVGRAGAELIHYPYTSFQHQLAKLNTYAQQGAEYLIAHKKRGGIIPGLAHGCGRFLRLYILKRGFLDGKAGFLVAIHGSFYAFIKYARVLQSTWGEPFDHE